MAILFYKTVTTQSTLELISATFIYAMLNAYIKNTVNNEILHT